MYEPKEPSDKSKWTLTCEACHQTLKTHVELAFHAYKQHNKPYDFHKFQDKTFRCNELGCDFFTIYHEVFVRHQAEQHGIPMPFQCEVCHHQSPTERLHQRHMFIHAAVKPFVCNLCDFICTSEYSLQMHKSAEHNAPTKMLCGHCPKSYMNKQDLFNHIAKHHPHGDMSPSVQMHKCSQCDYVTSKKGKLSEHLQKHEKREYICSVCKKVFKLAKEFKEHERTHKAYPFKCTMAGCTYSSLKKNFLTQHYNKVHAPPKEKEIDLDHFDCPHCDYNTDDKRDFRKHMRAMHNMTMEASQQMRLKIPANPELGASSTVTSPSPDIQYPSCSGENSNTYPGHPNFVDKTIENVVLGNNKLSPVMKIDDGRDGILEQAMKEIIPVSSTSSSCRLQQNMPYPIVTSPYQSSRSNSRHSSSSGLDVLANVAASSSKSSGSHTVTDLTSHSAHALSLGSHQPLSLVSSPSLSVISQPPHTGYYNLNPRYTTAAGMHHINPPVFMQPVMPYLSNVVVDARCQLNTPRPWPPGGHPH